MKRIIKSIEKSFIEYSALKEGSIIAYKLKSKCTTISILQQLSDNENPLLYGFVHLGQPNWNPSFIKDNYFDSIKDAMLTEDLMLFDNLQELGNWINFELITNY